MNNKSLLHDFLNNGMRIEILTKLISEAIEKEIIPEQQQLTDLTDSIEKHTTILNKFSFD